MANRNIVRSESLSSTRRIAAKAESLIDSAPRKNPNAVRWLEPGERGLNGLACAARTKRLRMNRNQSAARVQRAGTVRHRIVVVVRLIIGCPHSHVHVRVDRRAGRRTDRGKRAVGV